MQNASIRRPGSPGSICLVFCTDLGAGSRREDSTKMIFEKKGVENRSYILKYGKPGKKSSDWNSEPRVARGSYGAKAPCRHAPDPQIHVTPRLLHHTPLMPHSPPFPKPDSPTISFLRFETTMTCVRSLPLKVQNTPKIPPGDPARRINALAVHRSDLDSKKCVLGDKRHGIRRNARCWKQRLKYSVESPNPHYSAKMLRLEFRN